MTERIRTIAHAGSEELSVKKSRFICTLQRVSTEEDAKAFISEIRKQFWDANHNCTAWVLGARGESQRTSDDGEPSGTAGQPMLNVLNQRELTDVVAVVTRYFGGTLLGAGGLIRAYGQVVSNAIDAVGIVERKKQLVVAIEAPHDIAGKLEFALRGTSFPVTNIEYDAAVTFELHIEPEELASLETWLGEATIGQCGVDVIGQQTVEVPVGSNPT